MNKLDIKKKGYIYFFIKFLFYLLLPPFTVVYLTVYHYKKTKLM